MATKRRTTRKKTVRATRRPVRRKTTKRKTKSAKRKTAAKKGWKTRRRNAAKRSTAAKKAARSRKSARKAPKRRTARRKTATKRRGTTKAKRAAAARKGWKTRKAKSAKRSRAAKKAARTRKGPKRRTARRKTTKRRYVSKHKAGTVSGYYNTIRSNAMELGPFMMAAAGGVALMGAYSMIKPYTWDYLGLTGSGGALVGSGVPSVISSAVPGEAGTDVSNLYEAALGLGTMAVIAGAMYKYGIVAKKTSTNMMAAAGLIVGLNALNGLNTLGIGDKAQSLAEGDLTGSFNFQGISLGGFGTTHNPMATTNMSSNSLQQALVSQNSSAASGPGFFGTQKKLGATRVNLF